MKYQNCLILLLTLFGIGSVESACNVCSTPTYIACINQTSFQRCTGSTLLPGVITCPVGSFCNTESVMRCVPTNPSCGGNCGVCNSLTYVACRSRTEYSYCFGSVPSNQILSCNTGEVCNSDDPETCINITIRPTAPTCPDANVPPTNAPTTTSPTTASPTGTTPSTGTEAQRFCRSVKYPGRYSNPNDFNCKSYYLCYYSGNVINGQEYQCLGQTFFNCQTRSCNYQCRYCPRDLISGNETDTTI